MSKVLTVLRSVVVGAGVCSLAVIAADRVNPNQSRIDELNDKKALLEAEEALKKVENSLAKEKYPEFPDSFGKQGGLTLTGTDTVRIAAKASLALEAAGKRIADILKGEPSQVALITDADRIAIPLYWTEITTIQRLQLNANEILEKSGTVTTAETPDLATIGALLSQVAQFTKLFRTDKEATFTASSISDEMLFDIVAANAPEKVLYPSADVDVLLTFEAKSGFAKSLAILIESRDALSKISDKNTKSAAEATVQKIDEVLTRLATVEPNSKNLYLLMALRGERASEHMQNAKGRILSAKILAQGGTAVKSESIWRSDRYYASGNVVVQYRITSAEMPGKVLKSGVLASNTSLELIPLGQ